MKKQAELAFGKQIEKLKGKDEFAVSCRPLEELLDLVRDIEGFPIAKDENILALSDPPYYTACPNPYINDFIAHYGKLYDEKTDTYQMKPFVADVSEGKNDPIYNAHSYHTKVPHKAIMPFIEHYTEPGDIVFDGFCGTGMTGVAAQMLSRRAILCDLSPAATFIAYNYNTPVDIEEFEREARRILAEVEDECSWMYETVHSDGKIKGKINYTVWSDVFLCPYCSNEYVFWDVAVDKETGKVKDKYPCPHCNAAVTKRQSERATVTFFDDAIREEITQATQVPVLINYSVGKKRYEKAPDEADLDLIRTIEKSAIPYWFPTDRMPEGDESRRNDKVGITHVHHFYTKRNLWVLAKVLHAVRMTDNDLLYIWLTSSMIRTTKMYKFTLDRKMGTVTGTYYIPSLWAENKSLKLLERKLGDFTKITVPQNNQSMVETTSTSSIQTTINASVDYIFTDPPFGDNLMYSELNFLWESWLRVFTNNQPEAIINNVQHKGLSEYKELMTSCFKEMYRILKPNRWITVVFHNSKASVWNAIQDAISRAGFVIAQVTILDKKQGSFKQVTSAGAVKNDLVINAYKPKKEFEEHFLRMAGEGLEKEFVQEHLDHLPVEINIERTEQMLYSKMLAHYIRRGYEIRMNARQFYAMLRDNFKLIDGYWFNDDQVLPYEEWKKAQGLDKIREIKSGEQILFVSDEKSLLVWIYQFLETPQTYSDIYVASRKIIAGIEDEIPELRELLDQNFVLENEAYHRPRTREEQEMIDAQREKDLLRSFEQILNTSKSSSKKIKGVRKEALIAGFTQAYQGKRYQDIVDVAKRLNAKIIENDSQINDFVEFARFKIGEVL
ncbi:MAG: DNA methyltransferase [Syntrophomonadaceae bacterium]|nr:DNA methyltransferase [Syntrophomonadaceae bacterium]